jgi:hypothetical protein
VDRKPDRLAFSIKIYFYNDDRAHAPWGDTRPDYGRNEVRQYIFDNVFMWLEEYHVDGLRFDGTAYIHSFPGPGGQDLPERWSLLQWINGKVADEYPGRITRLAGLQRKHRRLSEHRRGHRTGRVRRLPLPRRAFHWSLQRADLFTMIERNFRSQWVDYPQCDDLAFRNQYAIGIL